MRTQKNVPEQLKLADFADKSLLILDDDDPLRGRLARAMEKKGFQIKEAKSVAEGLKIAKTAPTAFAVIDLCLLYTSPSPRDRSLSRMPSSA